MKDTDLLRMVLPGDDKETAISYDETTK